MLWLVAMLFDALLCLAAARFPPKGRPTFAYTLCVVVASAMVALGASFTFSSGMALVLRTVSPRLYEEVYHAILLAAAIAGGFVGIFGVRLVRYAAFTLTGAGKPTQPGFLHLRRTSRPRRAPRALADRRYASANKAAWPLIALVIASCLWRNAPNWWLLCLCVIIAGTTVVAVWFLPGKVSRKAFQSDANSALFMLTGFIPLGLTLRAIYRFELVDWEWPVVVAAVTGLPIAFLLARPLRGPSAGPIGTAILSLFLTYSGPGSLIWSGLQFANAVGNPVLVAVHRVRIAYKHAQRGRHDITYTLRAANPPELNSITNLRVNKSTYESVSLGGEACIEVWQGWLPLRWYRVTDCKAPG
ncbi:MAG: hypothetical protein ABI673_04990 [Novosphingobium sp.]